MSDLYIDRPAFEPRRLTVVCIGAGLSGLTLAHKIQHDSRYSCIDLTILEKNADVAGTWYENIYPGVACDIPAHSYCFPFAPNPDWSAYYVSGPEIFAYIKRTVQAFHLDRDVKLNARVTDASWDEQQGQWNIAYEEDKSPKTTTADILINAAGFLNKAQWPDIEGLSSFSGQLVHSAIWPAGLDLKGKRVALIGNGSSAIQILPSILDDIKHVYHYIRNPTWIATPLAADQSKGGGNFKYTEEERAEFRKNPTTLYNVREDIEHRMNSRFSSVIAGSDMSEHARKVLVGLMEKRLNHNAEMIEQLVPKFPVSCRRITPGEGYLEALQSDKVTVKFDRIKGITAKGVALKQTPESSNEEDEVDIIICATGFDVGFVPSWPVTGRGTTLAQQWKTIPEAYLGIAVPNMPNYFVCCGPNTPVSQGSVTTVIDMVTDYMLKWCEKMSTQNIRSITVNSDATRELNDYMQGFLQRTVWAGDCRSWYKNGSRNGKITGVYGGSMVHFYELLQAFRSEDYDIQYLSKNRFRFLGNGRSRKEFTGENLGFYVKK